MADFDDWEQAADSDAVQITKDPKFNDEVDEAVPLDKPAEVVIKSQPKNADKEAAKKKIKQREEKWEDKEKKFEDVLNDKKGPLTAEELKEAQRRSELSDVKNTVDLFGGFIQKTEDQDLKTEKAFVDYAKKIGEILAKEDRKKYIQEFMKELLQQIYPKVTSLEYEDIHTKCQFLFNQKQKEEKGPTGKKKATQPKLNASKANIAQRAMGYDDDDDDEDAGTGGAARYDNDDFM